MHEPGDGTTRLAIFCGTADCSCPTLWVDHGAPPKQRLVLEDDFGQSVRFSVEQFSDLISQARDGSLNRLLQDLS